MNENWSIVRHGSEEHKMYQAQLAFRDEQIGFIYEWEADEKVNFSYSISMTKDSGISWDTIYYAPETDYRTSWCLFTDDETVAFALVSTEKPPIIIFSFDDGKAWDTLFLPRIEKPFPSEPAVNPKIVQVSDEKYIAKFYRGIYEITDKFTEVQEITERIPFENDEYIRTSDICVYQDTFFLLTHDTPVEIKFSTDSGESWSNKHSNIHKNNFFGTKLLSVENGKGYIVGTNIVDNQSVDSVYVSLDGLQTWQSIDIPIQDSYYISESVGNNLFLINNPFFVYRINPYSKKVQNYGAEIQNDAEPSVFSGVALLSKDLLYLVDGFHGNIWKYESSSSVGEIPEKYDSRLFPNPVSSDSKVFVSIANDENRTAKCTIVDIKGQAMTRSQEIQIPGGKHTIDFSTLSYPTGTYFLIIESEGEVIAREKFIVK